jgi:hypothetical protein
MVRSEKGFLLRWKCPGCNRTATDYPDFALPYKRYTLPTIQAFSQAYVENPSLTYRGLVDNCPLLYETKSGAEPGLEPMMEHSTIHRWISTLGGYFRLVQNATDLMLQADPTTPLCRDLAGLTVSPRKYMSAIRKQVLLTCFQLVTIAPRYRSGFQVSLFPMLATHVGYT